MGMRSLVCTSSVILSCEKLPLIRFLGAAVEERVRGHPVHTCQCKQNPTDNTDVKPTEKQKNYLVHHIFMLQKYKQLQSHEDRDFRLAKLFKEKTDRPFECPTHKSGSSWFFSLYMQRQCTMGRCAN